MAGNVLGGTTLTYGIGSGGGIREDLEDVIWDLFPEDTWAVSNLDKVEATATTHEWLSQQLAAPASNVGVEGDDATFLTLTAPVRWGNYTQIMAKTFLVSDTMEAVRKAGRGSEVARGAMVKMRELKRDLELAITTNVKAAVGSSGVGRTFGSMENWIWGVYKNATVGTTISASTAVIGAAATAATTTPSTSGVPVADIVDGTAVALTVTALNLALQGAWSNGGDPSVILTSAKNKLLIDAFAGVATRFVDVDAATQAPIIGAANVYVSDYGRHTVVLHRYMRDQTVLCLDPNYWAIAFLRRPMARELARTGDGTKYQIISEQTLVARNMQASAKVTALS
jgi:hypothetical protein